MRIELSASSQRAANPAAGLEDELNLSLPSDVSLIQEAVELVARHLESRLVEPRLVRFNLRVALTEAINNAILRGNQEDASKDVAVCVRFGPRAMRVEVTDQGDGFDPYHVPDPTLPENLTRPFGRGLFLIRRMVDEVRFNDKGNSICMILRRA